MAILTNIENIDNSANELLTRHTLNRNFEKLLRNDRQLQEYKESLKNVKNKIAIYSENTVYAVGDLIWYKYEGNLYLLQSLNNNNSNKPEKTKIEDKLGFEPSGWRDMYEIGSYTDNMNEADVSLSSQSPTIQTIIDAYSNLFYQKHVSDINMHKFGQLTTDEEYNNTKLLKTDLSNIDKNRIRNFYPYETIMLKKDNVIQSGYYRKWHCGVLEYDIIFQLGVTGTTKIDFITYNVVEANTLKLNDSKYYLEETDSEIFNQQGDDVIDINGMHQIGLNKFSNSYSGEINLPEPFSNSKYCVFGSDISIQTRDLQNQTIDFGTNKLVFTNKTESSITPVYIIQPSDYNKQGCLLNNSFHCKLVGRWK